MSICFINGMQLLIFFFSRWWVGMLSATVLVVVASSFSPIGLRQEYGMSIWTARRGAMLRAAYQNGAAHLCFLSFF